MLQKLNERIQGIVAWVVITLITLTFALFGIDYYIQSHGRSNSQVDVNDESISKEQFELTYRRSRQMRDSATISATSEEQLKKQVLEDMIVNRISVQAALKSGFEVSSTQANAAILGIPQFQEDGRFSPGRFQQVLSSALFTPETFKNEVRQGMLLNQQRFAFIGTSYALPSEVKRFVKLYMQNRDYQYLVIPASLYLPKIKVNDAEIKDYYENHQETFLTPEKVSLSYVQLSISDLKNKTHVNDEQLKHYYEENQGNYTIPAQWRVAHILFAVPKGASESQKKIIKDKAQKTHLKLENQPEAFDEQVKTISDDKVSLKAHGVLPWIVAGNSELDKHLIHLTKTGQISTPIETPYGYEIFKLIAYKPSSLKPFSMVKNEIREQMVVDIAQNQYAKHLETLSDLSYRTPDTLEPVTQALDLPVQHSELFSTVGGTTPLTQNKNVLYAAFSHDVLKLGNNSDPIQLSPDSVVVLRVNKHIRAKQKKLADVKTSIIKQIKVKKSQDMAKSFGEQLIMMAKQNASSIKKRVMGSELDWKVVRNAVREASSVSQEINALGFSLTLRDPFAGRSLKNGDFALLQLQDVHEGSLESLDKDQASNIKQQIAANYGLMDYELYINSLMSKASIERH